MSLVHPLLALGALFAVVPLIIHLLNRRRHRPLDWAAMRFAQAAWKKIRRRTRFENLLLLLLRMAAVAILAIALARPFTAGGGPLAGLTEERRDLVLLLDGSASMGYRPGLDAVWDAAVERATGLVEDLDAGAGDRARLYLVGDHPRLLADRAPAEALAMLATLEEPLDEGLDLAAALTRVLADLDDAADLDTARRDLVLVTDAQRGNFLDERGTRAARELEQLAERGLELRVVAVSEAAEGEDPARRPPNLAVTDLGLLDPFGEPLTAEGRGAAPVPREASATFLARVENSGPRPRDVRVALEVDGERRPAKRVTVPADGALDVLLDARLDPATEAGAGSFHRVAAVLEADGLVVDDRRPLVVYAARTVEVLLVDGDPAADLVEDEVGYLRAALEPGGGDGEPGAFRVTVLTPEELSERVAADELDLGRFAMVWLANVETLSPTWTLPLEARVAAGATLVVSLGDRVEPGRYEERLGGELGLLPARLGERRGTSGRRGDYRRARIERPEHPLLAFFADERYEVYLTEVPVTAYLASTPLDGARVLATLDDAVTDGSPLLVERDHGRGKVVLWTTSIDADWTAFPESPTSLIPLVHELAHGAVQPAGPARNLPVGAGLAAELATFPEGPALLAPTGSARAIDAEATELDGGTWRLDDLGTADRAGFWRLRTAGGGEAAFAVGLDPRESDLERLPVAELGALSPAYAVGDATVSGGATGGDDGELWRPLVALVLLLLVGESLWARRLAREEAR